MILKRINIQISYDDDDDDAGNNNEQHNGGTRTTIRLTTNGTVESAIEMRETRSRDDDCAEYLD